MTWEPNKIVSNHQTTVQKNYQYKVHADLNDRHHTTPLILEGRNKVDFFAIFLFVSHACRRCYMNVHLASTTAWHSTFWFDFYTHTAVCMFRNARRNSHELKHLLVTKNESTYPNEPN